MSALYETFFLTSFLFGLNFLISLIGSFKDPSANKNDVYLSLLLTVLSVALWYGARWDRLYQECAQNYESEQLGYASIEACIEQHSPVWRSRPEDN